MKLKILMKIQNYPYFFLSFLALIFLHHCEKKKDDVNDLPVKNIQLSEQLISQIVSMDTLNNVDRSEIVNNLTKELSQLENHQRDPFYLFFKAHQFKINKKPDSAAIYFGKMQVNDNEVLSQIKSISLFYNELETEGFANSDFMNRLFKKIKEAEKKKTIFTYRFYDIAAQAYFLNRDAKKSLEFSELYFKNNPFRNNRKTKQRFYEISFLLSAEMKNFNKMEDYLRLSQNLAFQINDSLAIARSYDMQARMFDIKKQHKMGLESSKKSFFI